MTATDHVIWDNLPERGPLTLLPEQQLVMRCKHCGDRYVLAIPASVGLVAVVARQYVREHRHCKPPRGNESL